MLSDFEMTHYGGRCQSCYYKSLKPVPKEDIEVVDFGPPSNEIFALRLEKNNEKR